MKQIIASAWNNMKQIIVSVFFDTTTTHTIGNVIFCIFKFKNSNLLTLIISYNCKVYKCGLPKLTFFLAFNMYPRGLPKLTSFLVDILSYTIRRIIFCIFKFNS